MSDIHSKSKSLSHHVVTMEKIDSTIELLERVHRIDLKDFREFIRENKAGVLENINGLAPTASIDSKFSTMDGTFSKLPNYQNYSHYMLEFAVLVS